VTTDGEFHTMRRQFDRIEEEGIEVCRVPAEPVATLAERLAAEVDSRTALVGVSSVMFRSAHIVPDLGALADACGREGAALLVDTYHALNAVPFSVADQGLDSAFIVGGGYKYCQLGEGNCFLRIPAACELRPVITGWYAEFEALEDRHDGTVRYGSGPGRFAGATYDPTAHYRAAAVFDYFEERGLDATLLREVSQHQIALLSEAVDALDIDPAIVTRDRVTPLEATGGFLALQTPHAAALSASLYDRGVSNDFRDEVLRLGPAPYLSDSQLYAAIEHLGQAVQELTR
jgi:kynureninase